MVTDGLHHVVERLVPPRKDRGVLLNIACENWWPERGQEGCQDWDPEEKNYEVHNCDRLPDRPVPNLKVCDLNGPWPYPDNFAHDILSVEAIEHLENPWHHFREAKRILKPGGVLILTTPNILSPKSREMWPYFNWFGPGEWEKGEHINPIPVFEFRLICRCLDLDIERELYHPPDEKTNLVLVVRVRSDG